MNQIDLNITNQFTLIIFGDMFSLQIQGPQAQIFRAMESKLHLGDPNMAELFRCSEVGFVEILDMPSGYVKIAIENCH